MLSARLQNELARAPFSKRLGGIIPTCSEYAELLAEMQRRTGEDMNTLREKYGQFTYGNWAVALSETRMNMPVTYHRNPTQAEINFGYGAIHYRDFELADCLNEKGQIKRWFMAKDDGLRYYYD